MSDSEAVGASGAVDRLAGLVEAAEGDRRARRALLGRASRVLAADAEAERRARMVVVEAEQRARAVESDADARIRAAEARLRVRERERAADRAERDAARAERLAAREVRAETAALRRVRWAGRRDWASAAAPAALSMLVYLAAVASAVFGQVSVATGRYHWAVWRALVLAGFIELMALAMATTANRLRLRGERALSPRVLTWVFASFAAGVNVWGHWADPLMAIGLGAASLGGITLWEIRSSARHRDALRAAGQLAHPLPSLGLRFWLSQPPVAAAAYRIGIRTRVSTAAEPLVERAIAERAVRVAARGGNGRGWPMVFGAVLGGSAFGVAATVLSAGRLPVDGNAAVWWVGAAALLVMGVIMPAVVRAARRGVDVRGIASDARVHDGVVCARQEVSAPVPGVVGAARCDGLPASDVLLRARQQAAATPVRGVSCARTDTAFDAAGGVSAGAALGGHVPPPGLGDTGEFRALTAPEHYERDATDGLAPLASVLRAARIAPVGAGDTSAADTATSVRVRAQDIAAASDSGAVPAADVSAQCGRAAAVARAVPASDARALRGISGAARQEAADARALRGTSDARALRGTVSAARQEAADTAHGQVSDAARREASTAAGARTSKPRRGTIPDDARRWLTEQVRAGHGPSGPEIGRRFGVDPSTGRRWLNRVRDSLPPE